MPDDLKKLITDAYHKAEDVSAKMDELYQDNFDNSDNSDDTGEYHCAQMARNAIQNAKDALASIHYCINSSSNTGLCSKETLSLCFSHAKAEIAFATTILQHYNFFDHIKLQSELSTLEQLLNSDTENYIKRKGRVYGE